MTMRPESAFCPPPPPSPTFRAKELSVSDLPKAQSFPVDDVLSQTDCTGSPELRGKGKGIISLTATEVGLGRAGLCSLQPRLAPSTLQHRGRRRWVHGALAQ